LTSREIERGRPCAALADVQDEAHASKPSSPTNAAIESRRTRWNDGSILWGCLGGCESGANREIAALTPDLYERLIDRLRHAEQYAQAAREMAEGALTTFRAEEEVLAMTASLAPELDERLAHRLRHAQQYAEAARRTAEEALELLEAAKDSP
jgi:ABC-type nitrate/sulfonate/bicarbonate transport system substrate-binding protein